MSLGDLHNNREKLRAELRVIKYNDPIDIKGLSEGEATSILPIIHYCLLSYSKVFAEYIVDQGFDIMTKNDFNFLESVFKLLRQKFNYRPVLKIGQFLATGYAERKIMMLLDLIKMVKTRTNELTRYQQVEERKSKSPFRSNEEENLKIQTPPKPSAKVYKDPEDIILDYANILKKSKNSISFAKFEEPIEQELSDENEKEDAISILQRLCNELKEENKILNKRINDQDSIIKNMKKKHENDLNQLEAKIHLLSSRVKMIEQPIEKKESVPKLEKKQEEGLLSKLGISSNHLAYRAYDHNPDSFENY
jgi:Centrosomal spindle body, CEP44